MTLERRSEVTGREIYTDAMAEAGKKLAVQWGHAPWSDSWAQLVAKTLDDAACAAHEAQYLAVRVRRHQRGA